MLDYMEKEDRNIFLILFVVFGLTLLICRIL